MRECGGYPLGAEFDDYAPYNEGCFILRDILSEDTDEDEG